MTQYKQMLTSKYRSGLTATIPSLSHPSRCVFLFRSVVEDPKVLDEWAQSPEGDALGQELFCTLKDSANHEESLLLLAMLQQLGQNPSFSGRSRFRSAKMNWTDKPTDFYSLLQVVSIDEMSPVLKIAIASTLDTMSRNHQ